MKQLLLTGGLILTVVSMTSQTTDKSVSGTINMVEKISARKQQLYRANEAAPNTAAVQGPSMPQNQRSAQVAGNWKKISGSMNIYGVLEISGKPLQYNDELNAVSFIHRKSQSYVPSPAFTPSTAASGAIVAMVTNNCGDSWDSTLVWNNATNWARYPQGGIYNPPGNTSLNNAHVVVSGPLTAATSSWVGSYLASKPLAVPGNTAVYNNVASMALGAQQFVPNSGTNIPVSIGKVDYPSFSFTSTDDGVVRTLGSVVNDFNGTGSARKYRGAKILKGTFSSGVFTWSADSLIVAPLTATTSAGDHRLLDEPHMAWNESGTVGYVVQFGCRLNATGSEAGFQPIVYKTTNSGSTWSLMPAITFTSPAFQNKVLNPLKTASLSNVAIPFFNISEGVSCVVDGENKLHIVSTILSTGSSDVDQLGTVWTYTDSADLEVYNFPYTPGKQPYIYDFIETANGWDVIVVDSMATEGPGIRAGEDGFNDNPWDATGGAGNDEKIPSSARIQACRTPDGSHIVYTWAESDLFTTPSGRHWNSIPNLKARAYDVLNKQLSRNRVDLTSNARVEVSSRAHMHHLSPKCIFVSKAYGLLKVSLPITITNNQSSPLTQQLPNDHWYDCSQQNFYFQGQDVGLNEKRIVSGEVVLFPNPTSGNVTLSFAANSSQETRVSIFNLVGQEVLHEVIAAQAGQNTLDLNLQQFEKGVYFVTVDSGSTNVTKKIIKE